MSIVRCINFMNGEESIGVHLDKREDLIEAMRWKAKNIKAHADPEIFETVANALENSVEVVRCKDCINAGIEKGCGPHELFCYRLGDAVKENEYCSRAKRKTE